MAWSGQTSMFAKRMLREMLSKEPARAVLLLLTLAVWSHDSCACGVSLLLSEEEDVTVTRFSTSNGTSPGAIGITSRTFVALILYSVHGTMPPEGLYISGAVVLLMGSWLGLFSPHHAKIGRYRDTCKLLLGKVDRRRSDPGIVLSDSMRSRSSSTSNWKLVPFCSSPVLL